MDSLQNELRIDVEMSVFVPHSKHDPRSRKLPKQGSCPIHLKEPPID
jgi:hypothetical protein